MGKLAVETRSTQPVNFFAGDFPTVPESGIAGEAIPARSPVTTDEDGNIVIVKAAAGDKAGTLDNIIGITVEAAAKDEPVVYYMTGEFHADAITLPSGVEIEALKAACRKISIFLK